MNSASPTPFLKIAGHGLWLFMAIALAILSMVAPVLGQWIAFAFVVLILVFLRPRGREYGVVALVAGLFFMLDNMAISQGFFVYSSSDIWHVPYWAPIAWSFWVLHAYRVLPYDRTRMFSGRLIALAVLFSSGFVLPLDPVMTLALTGGALCVTLAVFHGRYDVVYMAYFSGMGIVIETIGLMFGLWSYPNRELGFSIIQFIVMWAGVGIYSRAVIPYFIQASIGQKSDV